MIVIPKREEITYEGKLCTFLSLYSQDNELLIRSTAMNMLDDIFVTYDGLIYCSFAKYPQQCFIDYAATVAKFKK